MEDHYTFSESGVLTNTITDFIHNKTSQRRSEILNGSVSNNNLKIIIDKLIIPLNPQDLYEQFYFINKRKDVQNIIFENDSFTEIKNSNNTNKINTKSLRTNSRTTNNKNNNYAIYSKRNQKNSKLNFEFKLQ